MSNKPSKTVNVLSIDVEDYWRNLSCDWLGTEIKQTEAVLRNTRKLLGIFDDYHVKATFFVLGEVAENFPELVQEICNLGHEIAVHGYHHYVIYTIDRKKFHQEVSDAKKLIEDLLGHQVHGHRAPSFSITPKTRWAFDVFAEVGYSYDSSVFPFSGTRYGWPNFCKDICEIELENGSKIIEVPMSTINILGWNFPACGGGYLRHFPFIYTQWAINRIQQKRPAIVYMHPYDFDTELGPNEIELKMKTTAPKRAKRWYVAQLRNRHTVESKLKLLLNMYKFAPICDVIAAKQTQKREYLANSQPEPKRKSKGT